MILYLRRTLVLSVILFSIVQASAQDSCNFYYRKYLWHRDNIIRSDSISKEFIQMANLFNELRKESKDSATVSFANQYYNECKASLNHVNGLIQASELAIDLLKIKLLGCPESKLIIQPIRK